jgi:hypothetical protein
MQDIFFKSAEHYTDKLDPIREYIKQLSSYISVRHNIDIAKAKEIATSIVKENIKDKTVRHYERLENGDRQITSTPLLQYIYNTIKQNKILTPTFTTYQPKSTHVSVLSQFINRNVKARSLAKKVAQKAKATGDTDLFLSKNSEQNNMKIYNNSLSGAFAQESCILHNPTGHSTLTSITRTITGIANACNEKLVAGNRFYSKPIDVLNDIVYIATTCNLEEIALAVQKYNLYIPTIEDTVNVLKYSSDLYFISQAYYDTYIIPYLSKLSPLHLAAICYCGDLYHIRKYNSDFLLEFTKKLIEKKVQANTDDVVDKLYKVNENILNFVHQIYYSEVKGKGKDYTKMLDNNLAGSIYATSQNVVKAIGEYRDFFRAFFLNNILPCNGHALRYMRRRAVVLSDTDSTCFTLDNWVKWYNGSFNITDETIAASCSVGFIASQVIIHQLALFSSFMNVDKEDINKLTMKNEYLWLAHVPASVSKHYFAYTVMQEGNVFSEPEIEIKGVHLKNSAVPKTIIADAKDIMEYILKSVANNEKVSFNKVLKRIIDLEKEITDSIHNNETKYLKKSKIKNKEAYSLDETKSPYQRHQFWEDVFKPKYGSVELLPYDVVKIPTTVTSRKNIKEWVDSIEDKGLGARLQDWLVKYNKDRLETIYLNEGYVLAYGIPQEIKQVIDVNRIVLDITIQHRLILETLGVLIDGDRLVSEQFKLV